MKQELVISPSVLSLDYGNVSEQLNMLNATRAKWMHFDVMDGHFVPNLTFGPDILKGFKKAVDMFMDVHLMITDPKKYAPIFIKAGADLVTFHLEAVKDVEECVELCKEIRALGAKAGVSVKPKTPVESLLPYLNEMDLVLIMSVEPGFGGQSFMEDQLEKVRTLRKYIDEHNLQVRIEIDGGINQNTAKLAKKAGCDTLVAGSYVFKNNIHEAVESLLCEE